MLGIYGHRDQTDLETAMDAYAGWLEQQRENEIVPPKLITESARLSRRVVLRGVLSSPSHALRRLIDG
jgi:hypothetical protein